MTMQNRSTHRRTNLARPLQHIMGAAAAMVLVAGCGNDNGGDLQRGEELRITEDGATANVHCDSGGRVHVETRNAQVEITGDCEGADVEGYDNTVSAENVETANLQGESNTLTATRIGELSVEGINNSVQAEEIQRIELEGVNNSVTYETGDPAIEQEGVNNSVSRP